MTDTYWMSEADIIREYGAEAAEQMKNCPCLQAITMMAAPDGTLLTPRRDIELAYSWLKKQPIYVAEWD